MGLVEAMAALERAAQDRAAPMPTFEAIIARMKEAAPHYKQGPCPYRPGDLVTARKGRLIKEEMVGVPMLVIDTKENCPYDFDKGEPGVSDYGSRNNVRILQYQRHADSIVPMWIDSADLEPYVPGRG